jgi:hypothetical protein
MKKPYISLYAEEYPIQENINLVYDHLTQVNYLDKEKTIHAAFFGPRDKSIETRVIENSDDDESYAGPNTTRETATLEDTDEDNYQFAGPDTTILSETVENGDDVECQLGPPTTRQTFVVENDDEDEMLMAPDSTRITKTLEATDPDGYPII